MTVYIAKTHNKRKIHRALWQSSTSSTRKNLKTINLWLNPNKMNEFERRAKFGIKEVSDERALAKLSLNFRKKTRDCQFFYVTSVGAPDSHLSNFLFYEKNTLWLLSTISENFYLELICLFFKYLHLSSYYFVLIKRD